MSQKIDGVDNSRLLEFIDNFQRMSEEEKQDSFSVICDSMFAYFLATETESVEIQYDHDAVMKVSLEGMQSNLQ